jgi:hypothetical protein
MPRGSPPPGPRAARLFMTPVALDPGDPARRRVGGLVFRRGWVLTSDDPGFGGISSMHVEHGAVLALADTGTVFRFALPVRAGAETVRIAPLDAGPGAGRRKAARDSESLAVAGDDAWIGFEGANAIWRYRRADGRARAGAAPAAMRAWPGNAGPIAEDRNDGRAFSRALLFDGDPTAPGTRAAALRYRRVPGARPTDAAQLPDGRLLILNRHFAWLSGASATLMIADPAGLRPGGTIEGHTLAVLAPPLTVDNMEALSVSCAGGRTIVYLGSDNNMAPIQRTLFLEFALDPAIAGRC